MPRIKTLLLIQSLQVKLLKGFQAEAVQVSQQHFLLLSDQFFGLCLLIQHLQMQSVHFRLSASNELLRPNQLLSDLLQTFNFPFDHRVFLKQGRGISNG